MDESHREIVMRLEELGQKELEQVMPSLRAIKHDLGRYICFERRFVVDSEDIGELRRALRSDIRMTRRSGDESETCWDIWERLRPPVLNGDPDILIIDQAIKDIMSIDLDGQMDDLTRACELTERVRKSTRQLLFRGTEIHREGLQELPTGDHHG
jgi:hypothetical protein